MNPICNVVADKQRGEGMKGEGRREEKRKSKREQEKGKEKGTASTKG